MYEDVTNKLNPPIFKAFQPKRIIALKFKQDQDLT